MFSIDQSFTLSGWGRILHDLANGDIDIDFIADHDYRFIFGASLVPTAVLVLGVIIACVTLARLFCCFPKLQSSRGKSMCPSVVWGILSFGVAVSGLLIFLGTAQHGFGVTNSLLDDFASDVGEASSTALTLNSSVSSIQTSLDTIQSPDTCPSLPESVREALISAVQPLKTEVNHTSTLISEYSGQILPVSKQADQLTSGEALEVQGLLTALLSLPIVFVTLTCACMTAVLLGTSCLGHGSACAKCQDIFFFKLGSIGLAVTILLVAAVSTVQLASGIAISSFCSDVDTNMIAVLNKSIGVDSRFYIDHGPEAIDAAQFYITGQGKNPFEEQLLNASSKLNNISESLPQLIGFVNSTKVQQFCSSALDEPVNNIATQIDGAINMTQKSLMLLSRNDTIYPLYEKAMHQEVCEDVINGLGWLSLFQILVGMICLPCLSCSVAAFVHRRAYEQSSPVMTGAQVTLV